MLPVKRRLKQCLQYMGQMSVASHTASVSVHKPLPVAVRNLLKRVRGLCVISHVLMACGNNLSSEGIVRIIRIYQAEIMVCDAKRHT